MAEGKTDRIVVEIKDVVAGYLPGVNILNGANLIARKGELIGIIGPNGAGKSTLLKAVFGMVKVREGTVTVNGESVVGLKSDKLVQRGVGFVPQTNNVFPSLTIEENLQMGLYQAPKTYSERLEFVTGIFAELGKRLKQRAGSLSGGERQMVAMSRALMMDPAVLLLDEPSAGLSPVRQDDAFIRVSDINKAGVTTIMVEQNARRCLQICDRGYVLDQGRDAYEGTGRALLNDPKVIGLYLGNARRRSAVAPQRHDVAPDEQRMPRHPLFSLSPAAARRAIARRRRRQREGPRIAPGPSLRAAGSADALEQVVGTVLEDADGRLGRVAVLVERDRTGLAVVVGDATTEDDVGALRVGGALLTVSGATRDFLQLARDVGRVGRARRERGQREEDDRVVRLVRVREVGQRGVALGNPPVAHRGLELLVGLDRAGGRGALGAFEARAGRPLGVGTELLQVAVDEVEVLGGVARGEQCRADREDLVERDQQDGVGVGREQRADLRVERRVTRVVRLLLDDGAAGGRRRPP